MFTFKDLMIEGSGLVVVSFGRFNPPTIGHEKVIEKVSSIAGSAPMRIYPSHTVGPRDPLPHAKKIAYMRKMFPRYKKNIIADKKAKTIINIAVKLYDEGFTDMVMVAGSDRVAEFEKLLNSYNGVEGKRHGYYKFNTLRIINAGQRDPDSEGVEGMSASKMRAAAQASNYKEFKLGIPNTLNDKECKKLYLDVRKHLGIRESKEMGELTDFESMRDAYLTGQVWKIDDIVEANGHTGKVINRGTNYLSFVDENGKVHKTWLHDIVGVGSMTAPTGQIFALKSEAKSDEKEVELDEGKKLPPHLAKFFDKKGNLKKDAEKRIQKGRSKKNWKDVTPKGFGPKEEVELDEAWWNDLGAKISQVRHPKGWEKVAKEYIDGMDDPEHRNHPGAWAQSVALRYRGIDGRQLVKYINRLVSQGKLPRELRAQCEEKEQLTFANLVKEINSKETLNEWGEIEEAAEYQGKKVTLNKPFYTPDGPKKSAVYVKNEKGKVVIVRFGDPNMEIKADNPERRKSFRARHNCDNPGPKTKAKYWSCKAW